VTVATHSRVGPSVSAPRNELAPRFTYEIDTIQ